MYNSDNDIPKFIKTYNQIKVRASWLLHMDGDHAKDFDHYLAIAAKEYFDERNKHGIERT